MPKNKGSSKKPQSSIDASDDQFLDPNHSFLNDASPSTSPLDPTSAARRENQKEAISQLNETQARLIWEDDGASQHLTFRSLDSSTRFDNIEEMLKVYASIPFAGGKVSLCALLALAINDYTCYKGIPGMFEIYYVKHNIRPNQSF